MVLTILLMIGTGRGPVATTANLLQAIRARGLPIEFGEGFFLRTGAAHLHASTVTPSTDVLCGGPHGARTHDPRINIPLRFSPPSGDVRGLDCPFTVAFALGATRPVSTPSRLASGLARDCHLVYQEGFPDFEWCHPRGFPRGAPILLKSDALPTELEARTFSLAGDHARSRPPGRGRGGCASGSAATARGTRRRRRPR